MALLYVSWKRDVPFILRNCLGLYVLERGQSLVPTPPARITDFMDSIEITCFYDLLTHMGYPVAMPPDRGCGGTRSSP
ncbi:MAG: hypothetical protein A4E38_00012 [Methanoregulaceae archaeon PtaB.Bin108]|nr:MAG: hypothetical protein A4E38_00012 [Methanoregulaceae archaeon PtaB.Bin108]